MRIDYFALIRTRVYFKMESGFFYTDGPKCDFNSLPRMFTHLGQVRTFFVIVTTFSDRRLGIHAWKVKNLFQILLGLHMYFCY